MISTLDQSGSGARSRERARDLFWCCAVLSLSLLLAYGALQLGRADLDVPFSYGGDSMMLLALTKSLAEHGSLLTLPDLGAPGQLERHDFPTFSSLHFLLLWILARVCGPVQSFNLYFILGFPLIAVSAFWSLRALERTRPASAVGALLFAFLPYHFMRGEAHLTLASYYLVPPTIVVAFWLFGDRPPVAALGRPGKQDLLSVAVAVLVATSCVYYAFFGAFFFLIAGVVASLRRRSVVNLRSAVLLITVVFAGLVAQAGPTLLYHWRHGPNPEVAHRSASDSERYSLRLADLLLPVPGHRLELFAEWRARYERSSLRIGEGAAAVGAVAAAGVLLLLAWTLGGAMSRADEIGLAATGTVTALLLATTGGLGSLVARFLLPGIRAYNRISVFLAFFGLLAAVALLDRMLSRWRLARVWTIVVWTLVLGAGLLDQISPRFAPSHAAVKTRFASDRTFIAEIERLLPRGSSVFQLPAIEFPESPPRHGMVDYDHLRAYLHSHQLRWSYGAMRGRYVAIWQQYVASQPLPTMIELLRGAGFAGIYVDRHGFEDSGTAVEQSLSAQLGEPLLSPDRAQSFFSLLGGGSPVPAQPAGNQGLEVAGRPHLEELLVRWTSGCSGLETNGDSNWRWCGEVAHVRFVNGLDRDRWVRVRMGLATGDEEESELLITGGDLVRRVRLSSRTTPISLLFQVPPQGLLLTLRSDADLFDPPGDPRILVFSVFDFHWEEIRAGPG